MRRLKVKAEWLVLNHMRDDPCSDHMRDDPCSDHMRDDPCSDHMRDDPCSDHTRDDPCSDHMRDDPCSDHMRDDPCSDLTQFLVPPNECMEKKPNFCQAISASFQILFNSLSANNPPFNAV
jgi:pyrimidine deaminase RibD-like protein